MSAVALGRLGRLILLVVALSPMAPAAGAQALSLPAPPEWISLGPGYGALDLIVRDPADGSLVAGGYYAGLYTLPPGAPAWTRLDAPAGHPTTLHLRNGTLLLGIVGAPDGLYASEDDGATWRPLAWEIGPALAIADDSRGGRLWIATPTGIYSTPGLDERPIRMLRDEVPPGRDTRVWTGVAVAASDPKVVYAWASGCPGEGTCTRLHVSADAGASWRELPLPRDLLFPCDDTRTRHCNLAVHPFDPAHVVIQHPYGADESRDAGATWTKLFDDIKGGGVAGGLVAFDEFGELWASAGITHHQPLPGGDLGGIAFTSEVGRGYVVGDHGVYAFGGAPAIPSAGFENSLVTSVAVLDDRRRLVLSRQDWGPTASHDGGASWACPRPILCGGVENGRFVVAPSDDRVVYHFGSGGFWASEDAGRTFEARIAGLPLVGRITFGAEQLFVDPHDHRNLFVRIQSDSAHWSTDGGLTWRNETQLAYVGHAAVVNGTAIALGYTGGGERMGFFRGPVGGDLAYVGMPTYAATGKTVDYETRFLVDPDLPDTYYHSDGHRSTDGGLTFRPAFTIPDGGSLVRVDRVGGRVAFFALSGEGCCGQKLIVSFDRGASWSQLGGRLDGIDVREVVPGREDVNDTALATWGRGVLVLRPPPTTLAILERIESATERTAIVTVRATTPDGARLVGVVIRAVSDAWQAEAATRDDGTVVFTPPPGRHEVTLHVRAARHESDPLVVTVDVPAPPPTPTATPIAKPTATPTATPIATPTTTPPMATPPADHVAGSPTSRAPSQATPAAAAPGAVVVETLPQEGAQEVAIPPLLALSALVVAALAARGPRRR